MPNPGGICFDVAEGRLKVELTKLAPMYLNWPSFSAFIISSLGSVARQRRSLADGHYSTTARNASKTVPLDWPSLFRHYKLLLENSHDIPKHKNHQDITSVVAKLIFSITVFCPDNSRTVQARGLSLDSSWCSGLQALTQANLSGYPLRAVACLGPRHICDGINRCPGSKSTEHGFWSLDRHHHTIWQLIR